VTAVDGLGTIVKHPGRLFIGGEWVLPSTSATFDVIESATQEVCLRVAEAREGDMSRAVSAAREAFDEGPWPRMSHAERASYLSAMGAGIRDRGGDLAQIWPRESGVILPIASYISSLSAQMFDQYAGYAKTYPFEQVVPPTAGGEFGLLVREPVGVVGAIVPWNAPLTLIANKLPPALLAGCTVVLKLSPEAPGEGYVIAQIAEEIGLPAGVLNVVTADREVSEQLVRDPRIDKITFTGSTAAGRRIASLCGERIARCTLELGGKSAAVILDDADLASTAQTLANGECGMTGQSCGSLTRVIVPRAHHDELVDALAAVFAQVQVGDPFDPATRMGPLALERQRQRVEGYIATGIEEGATLAAGGSRPKHLTRGWYIEPTLFAGVDNGSTIAQEEIFGPVLSVIAADSEADAIAKANDTIYGLNASVFTEDANRARQVARQLRSGTVGHNAMRTDLGMAMGGFKQSGIGREGGIEGLLPYLETKTVILNGTPDGY
jgi:aldehyde dehydrogenase (NAD+)